MKLQSYTSGHSNVLQPERWLAKAVGDLACICSNVDAMTKLVDIIHEFNLLNHLTIKLLKIVKLRRRYQCAESGTYSIADDHQSPGPPK